MADKRASGGSRRQGGGHGGVSVGCGLLEVQYAVGQRESRVGTISFFFFFKYLFILYYILNKYRYFYSMIWYNTVLYIM